jgi:hypothetical protein
MDNDLKYGDYSSGNLAPSTKRSLIQAKNGNIIIGDVVFKYDSLSGDAAYHFLSLNAVDGALNWETGYEYFSNPFTVQDIVNIVELPDGGFSFQTSLNDHGSAIQKQLNIITDSKGSIKKMVAIYPLGDAASHIVDAKQDGNSGNQAVLISTSDNKTILVQVDRNGALNWSRKYGKSDNGIPPACFLKTNDAYDIILSNFSRSFHLLRTDPIGRVDCDSIGLIMMQETVPAFNESNVHTENVPPANDVLFSTGFFVVQTTDVNPISRSTVCQKIFHAV